MRLRLVIVAAGVTALVVAAIATPSDAASSLSATWRPFVLVAGLLLVGFVANEDGLFDAIARRLARAPGGELPILLGAMLLVAAVTAVLNLDTAAAFLTPVLILAVRHRGLDDDRLLYGTLFMCNAASLLLPGSNLTNLLVLSGAHRSGAHFAAAMWPAWLAAVLTTIVVLVCWPRRVHAIAPAPETRIVVLRIGAGVAAVTATVLLMLAVPDPAVFVLGVGIVAVAVLVFVHRLAPARAWAALDAPVILGLFGIAVALGTLGRSWHGPSHLLASAGAPATAAIAAGAAIALNNLPAAALLAARPVAHPRALLIGLNLGPNLAVSGSLSALLWFNTARHVGVRPNLLTVTKVGVVLVPLSIATALLANHYLASGSL